MSDLGFCGSVLELMRFGKRPSFVPSWPLQMPFAAQVKALLRPSSALTPDMVLDALEEERYVPDMMWLAFSYARKARQAAHSARQLTSVHCLAWTERKVDLRISWFISQLFAGFDPNPSAHRA